MKWFLLGHISMVSILVILFIVFVIFDDVPKGYRWLATWSCLFGAKRLGKVIHYRFTYWIVDGMTTYSFNHMVKTVNRDYTKTYRNIIITYNQRTEGYEIQTLKKRVTDGSFSDTAILKSEKVFLKQIWEKHGRDEKTYPRFLEKLNKIHDE